MVYYAKSKDRVLSENAVKRLNGSLEYLLTEMQDHLTGQEEKALTNAVWKITDSKSASQKQLQEHLKEAVACAEDFFDSFGKYFTEKEKKLIIFACAVHDLGKVSTEFQDMVISGKTVKQRVPHGILSAVTIEKRWFLEHFEEMDIEDFKVLITAVFYHHARDFDGDKNKLKDFCDKYYIRNLEDYLGQSVETLFYTNCNKLLFRKNQGDYEIEGDTWREYLVVKGMLNKFDWAVSAGYDKAESGSGHGERKLCESIEGRLGDRLRPAQTYMKNHTEDNLVIVAPTGSGKTEAALLWLDGNKGFYTLPLKVSSDAIYKRIKEEYGFREAALVHSDSMQNYLKEEENGYADYERARMLAQPLTVCTVDQLFKFAYKALGTEIYAATLKYSKLIIDEIQSYEPRVVAALITGLRIIRKLGGSFAIVTATFPPVLGYFMDKYGLMEGRDYLYQDFTRTAILERHKIVLKRQDFNLGEIAEAGQNQKVLVLCNTVRKAQEVYQELRVGMEERVHLLHSRFIRRDRALLEKMIIDFSGRKGETGIWISTQIVEASLDIDFDLLYTEMCPCDSLLQRMGRCNRSGRYYPEHANVIIYVNNNGVGKKKVYERDLYDVSVLRLEKYETIIFTEEMKSEYMKEVYCLESIAETDYFKSINYYLEYFDGIYPSDYSNEEANEKFRGINSIMVMPDIIYREHIREIEAYLEFLKQPNIGKAARAIVKAKLEEMTLTVNVYGRIPQGIDCKEKEGSQFHRSQLKYEFDEDGGLGRGLLMESLEEELLCL